VLLGRAGLEHRGLDHPHPLRGAEGATEDLFVFGDFRARFSINAGGAFAPQAQQLIGHAGNVGLAVLVHLAKRHAEALVHFVAQRGLVDLSGALLVMKQLGGVQRAPPAVGAPHLVQH
jgi:hypothetical protein